MTSHKQPVNYGQLWDLLHDKPRPGNLPSTSGEPDRAIRDNAAPMQSALDHANRDEAGWGHHALAFLLAYAALRGDAGFTGEDLVAASRGTVPEPPTDRAWGAVVQAAARRGQIVDTGRTGKRFNGNLTQVWAVKA